MIWYCVVKVLWFQTSIMLVRSNFATIGHFFVPLQAEDEVSPEEGEVFITQGFLSCSRTESCSFVFKEKRHSVLKYKPERAVWQKLKQPTDCKGLYETGKKDSGIYNIPIPNQKLLKVNCDMVTDGGGWTVIQRRIDNSTNFQRVWSDYKHGFGTIHNNMWIGLENMHQLASPTVSSNLRIEIKDRLNGEKIFFANYESFSISHETDGYRLLVSGYSGTAGDAFNVSVSDEERRSYSFPPIPRSNNGMQFSTIDRDNDGNFLTHCAARYNGGWWYFLGHSCHLNGLLPLTETPSYKWYSMESKYCCISFSEMKIRRN